MEYIRNAERQSINFKEIDFVIINHYKKWKGNQQEVPNSQYLYFKLKAVNKQTVNTRNP